MEDSLGHQCLAVADISPLGLYATRLPAEDVDFLSKHNCSVLTGRAAVTTQKYIWGGISLRYGKIGQGKKKHDAATYSQRLYVNRRDEMMKPLLTKATCVLHPT